MSSDSAKARLPHRYWRLWQATAASSLGDGLTLVALPLLAASITRNPELVSAVLVVRWLPWLFLALPAGVLADRLPRRTVLAVVEVVRMGTLGVLALCVASHALNLPVLYAISFAMGACETMFAAASVAALPAIVETHEFDRANGYLFAAQSAGLTVIGPAFGGVLFAFAAALPFVIDGVSFAASACLLFLAVPMLRVRRTQTSVRTELADGVRWFVGSPALRLLTVFTTGLALCQSMVLGILVLFGLEVLHLSRAGYGYFLAVLAVGQIAGAVYASRVKERFGAGRTLVGCALLAAAGYLVAGATASIVGAGIGLAAEAIAVAVGNVVGLSLRQAIVPAHMLGRVGNAARMCIFGAIPLGAAIGGFVARHSSLRTPLILACGLQVLLVAVAGRRLCAAIRDVEPAMVDRVEHIEIDLTDNEPLGVTLELS